MISDKLYQYIALPLIFRIFKDKEEEAHRFFMSLGVAYEQVPLLRSGLKYLCRYDHPLLAQKIAGLYFPNPIGLGGGFDKCCEMYNLKYECGFGFGEFGSVTALPHPGNPGRRLMRLPKDKSIIVYLGLNNHGREATFHDFMKQKRSRSVPIPGGINIAKTNTEQSLKEGIADYVLTINAFESEVDYITINLSCPNATGGLQFCETPENAKMLFDAFRNDCRHNKPYFLKLDPDMPYKNVRTLIDVVTGYEFIKGYIISNLTRNRDELKTSGYVLAQMPNGGIGGPAVAKKSNAMVAFVRDNAPRETVIIGLGGVSSAEHVIEKMEAGANLVQMVTGLIFYSPTRLKRINRDLVKYLKKKGLKDIKQLTRYV
ncbi:MAG: quinone-dependent dihydroorotate dehydrogenase [Patescibacteria group bacterium]